MREGLSKLNNTRSSVRIQSDSLLLQKLKIRGGIAEERRTTARRYIESWLGIRSFRFSSSFVRTCFCRPVHVKKKRASYLVLGKVPETIFPRRLAERKNISDLKFAFVSTCL